MSSDNQYVRGLSIAELNKRLTYLREIEGRHPGRSEARTSWIRAYSRELFLRDEMEKLAERVKTRSLSDLETQLGVAQRGAEKRIAKDWYERRVEVFEKEIARREVFYEDWTAGRVKNLSDDELEFWSRYYKRKLDSTDDMAWLIRWNRRYLAVVREKHARLTERVRKTQDDAIQSRFVAPEKQNYDFGPNVIKKHDLKPLAEKLTNQEDLFLFADDSNDFANFSWGKIEPLTIEFTSTDNELLNLIYGGNIMNWSTIETPYPLTRSLLRGRYSLNFTAAGVKLDTAETASNLERLSNELRDLDVPHSINVTAVGRRLVAELTTDAFKRLLSKLL